MLLYGVLLLTACNVAQQTQKESRLDNKIKCNEYGMENFYEEDDRNLTYFEQKFAYSPSLDTCLYYNHYSILGSDERTIKDIISGKGMAYYYRCIEGKACSESMKDNDSQRFNDFMDIYNKYFE